MAAAASTGDRSPLRFRNIVISPHFDDAVLSVGGLLSRLRGETALVTVHGGQPPDPLAVSDWDIGCGFTSGADAHAVRQSEDRDACELLGVEQVLLPHADNPYSAKQSLDALDEFLGLLRPHTNLFIPLGTNQRDHAAVRDRVLKLSPVAPDRLRIYADLPYTAAVPGWGSEDTGEVLAGSAKYGHAYQQLHASHGLRPVDMIKLTEEQWIRKRNAIFCYASQLIPLGAMFGRGGRGNMLRYPGPLSFEATWGLVRS